MLCVQVFLGVFWVCYASFLSTSGRSLVPKLSVCLISIKPKRGREKEIKVIKRRREREREREAGGETVFGEMSAMVQNEGCLSLWNLCLGSITVQRQKSVTIHTQTHSQHTYANTHTDAHTHPNTDPSHAGRGPRGREAEMRDVPRVDRPPKDFPLPSKACDFVFVRCVSNHSTDM